MQTTFAHHNEPNTNEDKDDKDDEYHMDEGEMSKTETEDGDHGIESEVKDLEDEAGEVEVGENKVGEMEAGEIKMGKMEAGKNKLGKNEVGENKAGESEASEDGYWGGSEHRQRMEYGQGAEGYDDRDEIRDRPSKSVIAQSEAGEQRACTETREQKA